MLRVEHLDKELPEFSLKDITFHLPKGYIMGLVGVNASGKSTLLKTILNIYRKDSGSVFVDGISMDTDEKKVKNLIGIVLNENFYENGFSAEENANYFGGYFDKYSHDDFLRYCRQFHVDTKKKLKKLSKGQQMKFQIAFALSHEAKLFIMDEPTGNLDQAFQQEFIEIMQELIADGERSILLSTHQTDTLDQIADYIAMLQDGKIMFTISKEELMEQFLLVSGSERKINALPEELLIYRETGVYNSMALIKQDMVTKKSITNVGKNDTYAIDRLDSELTVLQPTIEELMYFMTKGGFHNVAINMERQPSR